MIEELLGEVIRRADVVLAQKSPTYKGTAVAEKMSFESFVHAAQYKLDRALQMDHCQKQLDDLLDVINFTRFAAARAIQKLEAKKE